MKNIKKMCLGLVLVSSIICPAQKGFLEMTESEQYYELNESLKAMRTSLEKKNKTDAVWRMAHALLLCGLTFSLLETVSLLEHGR